MTALHVLRDFRGVNRSDEPSPSSSVLRIPSVIQPKQSASSTDSGQVMLRVPVCFLWKPTPESSSAVAWWISSYRRKLRGVAKNFGAAHLHDGARPASLQNCDSLSSVILCPFSRSRLSSISFNPPSRPAACWAFGRPRTTTLVRVEGPVCTTRSDAPCGANRLLALHAQDAGKGQVDALRLRNDPVLSRTGAVLSASIISSALSYRFRRSPMQRYTISFK